MAGELPEYYYRIRDKGASVYKVDAENRNRRIEMTQIAVANTNNGQIKPHGQHELTAEETAEIQRWMAAREKEMAERRIDDIRRSIDHLNLTAQWVQSDATEEELDRFTDELLLAMHDLRSILVRRKADRLLKARADAAE
ncbi:MAG: hypothetical protein ACU0DW_03300 [Shimia sp.]